MPDDIKQLNDGRAAILTAISAESMEEAAQIALEQRRASGEIMTYELDGWIVREFPGQRIVRLARKGEFRAKDHPVVA